MGLYYERFRKKEEEEAGTWEEKKKGEKKTLKKEKKGKEEEEENTVLKELYVQEYNWHLLSLYHVPGSILDAFYVV